MKYLVLLPLFALGCQKAALQSPTAQVVAKQSPRTAPADPVHTTEPGLPAMPPLPKDDIDLTLQPIIDLVLVQNGIEIEAAVKRNARGRLHIDGISQDNKTISKFMTALETHPSFHAVYLSSIEQFAEGRRFKLNAQFAP